MLIRQTERSENMMDLLEIAIPKDEQEEIREFVATLLLVPREDRAILLSNANAFKVRRDIEKARNKENIENGRTENRQEHKQAGNRNRERFC